jgi:hypothetical protein
MYICSVCCKSSKGYGKFSLWEKGKSMLIRLLNIKGGQIDVDVAVIYCSSYEYNDGKHCLLKEELNSLGGASLFVQKDEKILLKPNFLTAVL